MAKVRSGHLAPFAAAEPDTLADVRLQDGTVIADDVAFGDIGAFLELAAGTYDFKITTPDGATTLIDPMPVTVNDGDVVSVFAAGDGANQPLGAFALPKGQVGAFVDLAAALQVAPWHPLPLTLVRL
jgi:hypothetical protein